MRTEFKLLLLIAGLSAESTMAQQTCPLTELDLSKMSIGWAAVQTDKSVDGNPLRIGGREFSTGVGTHAGSTLHVNTHGTTARFKAWVGVDDEVSEAATSSVEFRVYADGRKIWTSGVMKAREAAKQVDVNLRGAKHVMLCVMGGADGIDYDHADWAEAVFEYSGEKPVAVDPPREPAVILTPAPPKTPRLTGPRVFGVRPGSPILHSVTATGERPLRFSAERLPPGVTLDADTGQLRGRVDRAGEYRIEVTARSALGGDTRVFRLKVGDRICLTPPLGWNSWNCFAADVNADKVRSAVDALIDSGLANHGWSTINIDDFWEVNPDSEDETLHGVGRDEDGRIVPNPRFPDMKALADYAHGHGLRIGLYSSPGPLTCGGCLGSYEHELLDAQRYAEWKFDYLKYDLCSYMQKIADMESLDEHMAPYTRMGKALRAQPRDIMYSLCQYGLVNVSSWGAKVDGNCWRTTGDITDTWESMAGIGFGQAGLEQYAEPGRWNDPDMLVVGWVGWGPQLRETRLTPNEQYTHVSLWSLLAAPMLLGCDLTKLDEFTLSLLTNDEVLAINQDPLGHQAARVAQDQEAETQVWSRPLENGSLAVGLFNLGEMETKVSAKWADLKITGPRVVRDVWRQRDLGTRDGSFEATVPRHGGVLVTLRASRAAQTRVEHGE